VAGCEVQDFDRPLGRRKVSDEPPVRDMAAVPGRNLADGRPGEQFPEHAGSGNQIGQQHRGVFTGRDGRESQIAPAGGT